ncbi:hypothetical protein E2C01_006595 [Portunus trituberculatus]|uniref:Uncharacterized protein n=1 Tax=Portunus trituberculatus TaxID=210409 RepID=A0A5B7CVI3_PORTR|nr:hypothetical protein [Portunus trituberculatus]
MDNLYDLDTRNMCLQPRANRGSRRTVPQRFKNKEKNVQPSLLSVRYKSNSTFSKTISNVHFIPAWWQPSTDTAERGKVLNPRSLMRNRVSEPHPATVKGLHVKQKEQGYHYRIHEGRKMPLHLFRSHFYRSVSGRLLCGLLVLTSLQADRRGIKGSTRVNE